MHILIYKHASRHQSPPLRYILLFIVIFIDGLSEKV